MMVRKRLGVCIALAISGWSLDALATISMSPSTITTTPALVNVETGTGSGTLSSTTQGDKVDLVIGPCAGGGGTFTLAPDNNLNLNSPVTINVTYSPTARGTRSCTVYVYDNGTTNQRATFNISGKGEIDGTASVVGSQAFGSVRWYDSAAIHTSTQNIGVTNVGDRNLTINSVAASGDFSVSGASTTLLPGNIATYAVVFNPSVAGARSGTLTIDASDGIHTVALSGTGTNAVISVADQAYGVVTAGFSTNFAIPITNTATTNPGPLYLASASISGSTWFSFSVCGGQSCTINQFINSSASLNVRCAPPAGTADGTPATATLTVVSDSDPSGAKTTSTLSCTAGQSVLSASPSSAVMFPGQLVGTTSAAQTVTIYNNGLSSYDFSFTKLAGTAAFNVSPACATAGSCSVPAKSGATPGQFSFSVTFTPPSEGDFSGGLQLTSGGAGPQITLAGRGIQRHIDVDAVVMFPDTFRNSPPEKATILPVPVRDSGEYMLTVSSATLADTGGGVWSLVEAPSSFVVPGLGAQDLMVKFSPLSGGKAPNGSLMIVSDDPDPLKQTITIQLVGNGKDRNVLMYYPENDIKLGDTGANIPIRLSDRSSQLVDVTNMDAESFKVSFGVMSPETNTFVVTDADGNDPSGTDLQPGETRHFDIVFSPTHVGTFEGLLTLSLDGDTHKTVNVNGRALFVNAHGSGGCSTGSGSGLLVALGALLLRRRRRR